MYHNIDRNRKYYLNLIVSMHFWKDRLQANIGIWWLVIVYKILRSTIQGCETNTSTTQIVTSKQAFISSNYSFKGVNDIDEDHCKSIDRNSSNRTSFRLFIIHKLIQVTLKKPKIQNGGPYFL